MGKWVILQWVEHLSSHLSHSLAHNMESSFDSAVTPECRAKKKP